LSSVLELTVIQKAPNLTFISYVEAGESASEDAETFTLAFSEDLKGAKALKM
jgi:hypothetical protein